MTRDEELALHTKISNLSNQLVEACKDLGVEFVGIEIDYKDGISHHCYPPGDRADHFIDQWIGRA